MTDQAKGGIGDDLSPEVKAYLDRKMAQFVEDMQARHNARDVALANIEATMDQLCQKISDTLGITERNLARAVDALIASRNELLAARGSGEKRWVLDCSAQLRSWMSDGRLMKCWRDTEHVHMLDDASKAEFEAWTRAQAQPNTRRPPVTPGDTTQGSSFLFGPEGWR